jgi:hypothetical protein
VHVTEERGNYQDCRKILNKELWLYFSHLDDQNKEHKTGRECTTCILEQFRDFGLACTENRSRVRSVHRDNIKKDVKDILCTVTSWILTWDVDQRYVLVNRLLYVCGTQRARSL